MNKYRGEQILTIGDQELTLVYDWAALSRIRSEMDLAAQERALSGEMGPLSEVVAAGLARYHPEWTAAKVFDASPPLMPTIRAVEAALNAAYYGPAGAPEEQERNPRSRTATLLSRLLKRLTGRASRRPNSGD